MNPGALSGTEDDYGSGSGPATSASAWALLLQRMAADGAAHEQVYEQNRRRLIVYFRLHFPAEAEALADLAFERIAAKLERGLVIEHLPAYTLGVARMLTLEARERHARQAQALVDPDFAPAPLPAPDEDDDETAAQTLEMDAALTHCLKQLGELRARLLLDYYRGEGEHLRSRRRQAEVLGVSLNSLANRALRARQQLEACIRARLRNGSTESGAAPSRENEA